MKAIEIFLEKKRETALAILFTDGVIEAWLPKSQIETLSDGETELLEVSVPEWLAKEKGFI